MKITNDFLKFAQSLLLALLTLTICITTLYALEVGVEDVINVSIQLWEQVLSFKVSFGDLMQAEKVNIVPVVAGIAAIGFAAHIISK